MEQQLNTNKNKKIAVIVLTFNSEEYLPDLLDSLDKTLWTDRPTLNPPLAKGGSWGGSASLGKKGRWGSEHEIIFVDNNSSDKTVEKIKNYIRSHPGTKEVSDRISVDSIVMLQSDNHFLIEDNKNLGYAGGNNVGMRYALGNGADYVVLLNDDTVVEPEWIQELVKIVQDKKDAGAVQSLLLYWDKKDTINSAGNHIHFLGFSFAGGNLQKITENKKSQKTKNHRITYASGAAVLYNANALKKTGLFDETLESYHEDSEMGLNMRLAGYKSYLAPKSVVYHKYQFKGGRGKTMGSGYKYYLMERNRLYFLFKYYSLKTLILIFPAWLVMEVGTLVFSFVRGFWREKIKAYLWLIKKMPQILEKRREIQKYKTMKDREFMHDFVGEISYQEINNPLLTYIGNPIINSYWRLVKKVL